jgi:tetratricopeptide (TPR) repeat protein
MVKYIYLFIFLLNLVLSNHGANAQKPDSLLRELNNYKKEDTIKLNLLNSISKAYQYTNIPKGLQIADTAIKLAQKLNEQSGLAMAYKVKGENYYRQNSYSLASELFKQALTIFELLGNKKGMADCLNDMGNIELKSNDKKALEFYKMAMLLNEQIGNKKAKAIYFANSGTYYKGISNFSKALEDYSAALKIYEKLNEKRALMAIYSNIGNINLLMSDYPTALSYCQKALMISEQLADSNGMINPLSTIGNMYIRLTDNEKALEYFKKALVVARQIGVRDTSHILNSIGTAYQNMAKYDEAIKYYLISVKAFEQSGNNAGLLRLLNNLGYLYYSISDYHAAMNCYNKALLAGKRPETNKNEISVVQLSIAELYRDVPDSILIQMGIDPKERYNKCLEYFNMGKQGAIEVGSLINQRYAWEGLSIMYEKQKDFPNALNSYKKYIVLRDKIINNEKEKKISRLTLQYEFDRKSDSIQIAKLKTDERLRKQELLAKQQQQQLELNKKILDFNIKEKDLQKLAYLKTQADLQNEQLLKQQKEKQLTISEKEKLLQSAQVITLSQENDLNKLKRRQQWFYSLGMLILLGLGASYFFYLNRLKQDKLKMELAKEKADQEIKETEFQRNLADISLTALRSQMNPHFIFNCLNSIKLYTTQNDTQAASEYLTKFSRLIRLVMENSRNDRISLSDELEALRLYIEMEAMRFKEKLSYTILVDKDVEMDYIEIPPLLLQPYVENAIWHGLMHKEEGGRIDITASMKKNESILEINIADNGVGRTKAEELQSKSATRHKSYGMKVTSERIALINQIYKTGANVAIHDIINDSGVVAGTHVIIQIAV